MTGTPIQPDPDALPDVEVLAHLNYLLACALEVTDVPEFGSPAWLALDVTDPRRQAALVLTAFAAWAAEHDLAAPIAGGRADREHAADLDVALGLAPATTWTAAVEAAAARRQQRHDRARAPRPGDHPGGPVTPWGPDAGRPAA